MNEKERCLMNTDPTEDDHAQIVDKTNNEMSVEDCTKNYRSLENCKNIINLLMDIFLEEPGISDSVADAVKAMVQVCRELDSKLPEDKHQRDILRSKMVSFKERKM